MNTPAISSLYLLATFTNEPQGATWSDYLHKYAGGVAWATFVFAATWGMSYRKFLQRRFSWLGHVAAFQVQRMIAPIRRWLMRHFPQESFDGIKIIDCSLRREIDQRFRPNTVAALRLIKSVDSRRFRRLQREIEYITNIESMWFAFYDRSLKRCVIDYSRFTNPDDQEWYLWWYAATLVHEATHGTIFSRGIYYTVNLRGRIERLCHTEQKRFAKKADTEERRWSEALVGPFDERHWHRPWNVSPWQKTKEFIARQREVRKSLAKEATDQNKK